MAPWRQRGRCKASLAAWRLAEPEKLRGPQSVGWRNAYVHGAIGMGKVLGWKPRFVPRARQKRCCSKTSGPPSDGLQPLATETDPSVDSMPSVAAPRAPISQELPPTPLQGSPCATVHNSTAIVGRLDGGRQGPAPGATARGSGCSGPCEWRSGAVTQTNPQLLTLAQTLRAGIATWSEPETLLGDGKPGLWAEPICLFMGHWHGQTLELEAKAD